MTLHTITLTTDQLRTLEMVLEDAHEATDDATDREEFEEREAIEECEQVVALALAPGLADGREGTCTACDLPINRAERSYQDRSKGWFLHKECWRDLNDSQT